MNSILFTANNWKSKWSYDQYKCFPTQLKKLIGFAKMHKFDEKQDAFIADKKRARRTSETSQSEPNANEDRVVCKIAKAIAFSIQNGVPLKMILVMFSTLN